MPRPACSPAGVRQHARQRHLQDAAAWPRASSTRGTSRTRRPCSPKRSARCGPSWRPCGPSPSTRLPIPSPSSARPWPCPPHRPPHRVLHRAAHGAPRADGVGHPAGGRRRRRGGRGSTSRRGRALGPGDRPLKASRVPRPGCRRSGDLVLPRPSHRPARRRRGRAGRPGRAVGGAGRRRRGRRGWPDHPARRGGASGRRGARPHGPSAADGQPPAGARLPQRSQPSAPKGISAR